MINHKENERRKITVVADNLLLISVSSISVEEVPMRPRDVTFQPKNVHGRPQVLFD